MKVLHATNRSNKPLYFVFCTSFHCTCSIYMEWLVVKRNLFVGSSGWTYGVMVVDAYSTRFDEFCSNWDCIGAGYFGSLPLVMTIDAMFNYDERSSYTARNWSDEATLSFTKASSSGSGFVGEVVDAVAYEVVNQVVGGVVTGTAGWVIS